MKIQRIEAREIFDSSGWPALQCELHLDNGDFVIASVPSGKSVGAYEAVELRDGGARFNGRGLLKAIHNIEHIIAPILVGQRISALPMDLKIVELDGTPDKSRLGANALLAVSMCLFKAEALSEGLEVYEYIAALSEADTVSMPYPLVELIDGGVHAENNVPIQEMMLMPVGSTSFRSAFEVTALVYQEFGQMLKKLGKSTEVGQESGYSCDFKDEREALDLMLEAIERINKKHSLSCVIALDIAASQLYNPETGLYRWRNDNLTADDLIALYQDLVNNYPIYSIEDGLNQDDWSGWQKLTKLMDKKAQIIGDDLTVTDIERISKAVQEKAITSVIIKPNQIGTVTEALQALYFAKTEGLNTIISHRSQETEETFIADLAVATSSGQIKAGSCRRASKYNRLLAIEDALTMSIFDT